MTDPQAQWEELELPAMLADRVVDAVRRRRWAVRLGATVLALTIGLTVGVVRTTQRRPSTSSAAAAGSSEASVSEASVYVAAIRAIDADYVAGVVAADVRRAVSRQVGSAVRFVSRPPVALPPGRSRLAVLGRAQLAGSRATVPVTVLCGPMCGEGETLVLTRSGGQWRVTGRSGPDWVT